MTGDEPRPVLRPDLSSIRSEQVVSMTEAELDEYFGRMASLSDGKSASIKNLMATPIIC